MVSRIVATVLFFINFKVKFQGWRFLVLAVEVGPLSQLEVSRRDVVELGQLCKVNSKENYVQ